MPEAHQSPTLLMSHNLSLGLISRNPSPTRASPKENVAQDRSKGSGRHRDGYLALLLQVRYLPSYCRIITFHAPIPPCMHSPSLLRSRFGCCLRPRAGDLEFGPRPRRASLTQTLPDESMTRRRYVIPTRIFQGLRPCLLDSSHGVVNPSEISHVTI